MLERTKDVRMHGIKQRYKGRQWWGGRREVCMRVCHYQIRSCISVTKLTSKQQLRGCFGAPDRVALLLLA